MRQHSGIYGKRTQYKRVELASRSIYFHCCNSDKDISDYVYRFYNFRPTITKVSYANDDFRRTDALGVIDLSKGLI